MDIITKYTLLYYLVCGIPCIGLAIFSFGNRKLPENCVAIFGGVFLVFLVFFIGFRPIGVQGFNDTPMYMQWFYQPGIPALSEKDYLFRFYIYLCAKIMPVRGFFLLSAAISFSLVYLISKKVSRERWFLFAVGIVSSLYFWNQQVFTIRQGMAALFFMLGVLEEKKSLKILYCLAAIGCHDSFLIVGAVYALAHLMKNTRFYLMAWIGVLVTALIFNYLDTEMFRDIFKWSLLDYYWMQKGNSPNIFRWDVVLYSLAALMIGYFNLKKTPPVYKEIVHLYIGVNALVILIIPFTFGFIHRFAYLSWFLIPLIIFYPLFSEERFSVKKFAVIINVFYFSVAGYVGYKIVTQEGYFIKQETAL